MVEQVGINMNQPVQQKKTGGAGKAIASTFIPGLGQFCDGRNAAGAGYLLGTLGTGLAAGALGKKAGDMVSDAYSELERTKYEAKTNAKIPDGPMDTFHSRIKTAQAEAIANSAEVKNAEKAFNLATKSAKKFTIPAVILGIASGIIGIANIVDAYKGDKNKE